MLDKADLWEFCDETMKSSSGHSNSFMFNVETKEIFSLNQTGQPCFGYLWTEFQTKLLKIQNEPIAFAVNKPPKTQDYEIFENILYNEDNSFRKLNKYKLPRVHDKHLGFIFPDLKSVPYAWLYSFCIFTRWPYEFNEEYKAFLWLKKHYPNVNVNLLIYLAHTYTFDFKTNTIDINMNTGHKTITMFWDKHQLYRFVSGDANINNNNQYKTLAEIKIPPSSNGYIPGFLVTCSNMWKLNFGRIPEDLIRLSEVYTSFNQLDKLIERMENLCEAQKKFIQPNERRDIE